MSKAEAIELRKVGKVMHNLNSQCGVAGQSSGGHTPNYPPLHLHPPPPASRKGEKWRKEAVISKLSSSCQTLGQMLVLLLPPVLCCPLQAAVTGVAA